MSDLEEENRHRSDWLMSAGQGENQIQSVLNRSTQAWKEAKKVYDAIQIPGELNTRVRAAIESEEKHRKHWFVQLMGAGAAVALGICCIIFQHKSELNTEYTNPSKSVTAQPESENRREILQTFFESGSEVESESETEAASDQSAEKTGEHVSRSKKREN